MLCTSRLNGEKSTRNVVMKKKKYIREERFKECAKRYEEIRSMTNVMYDYFMVTRLSREYWKKENLIVITTPSLRRLHFFSFPFHSVSSVSGILLF